MKNTVALSVSGALCIVVGSVSFYDFFSGPAGGSHASGLFVTGMFCMAAGFFCLNKSNKMLRDK